MACFPPVEQFCFFLLQIRFFQGEVLSSQIEVPTSDKKAVILHRGTRQGQKPFGSKSTTLAPWNDSVRLPGFGLNRL